MLPILALLIFALLDMGRAVYVYNTLSNAARAGARVAAVTRTRAARESAIRWTAPTGLSSPCILAEGVSIPIQRIISTSSTSAGLVHNRQLDPPCIAQVTVFQDYVPSDATRRRSIRDVPYGVYIRDACRGMVPMTKPLAGANAHRSLATIKHAGPSIEQTRYC